MEPLNVLGNLFITQLADDTTILFKRSEQLLLVMKNIEKFFKASGIHLIFNFNLIHLKGLAPTEKADQKTND